MRLLVRVRLSTLLSATQRHSRHQSVVVHSVKELFQIEIYHPAAFLSHILLGLGYRLMR